ncbi:MAG TPA: hypothetical protein VJU86_06510 [Pyrinomonadaceae bacterium]|nr:hypothetical protein [Pyrinomonadaceae bacterium]
MLTYLEAKQAFIDGFSRDINAHAAGRYEEVGAGFDDLDGALPREVGPEFVKLFIALNFWDGWIDSRNHAWLYYDGIEQFDWPVLAKHIVESLEADQEITEPTVLRHFDLRALGHPNGGPIRRLMNRLRT